MIEHEPSELEMLAERENPEESALREIEYLEDAHHFFKPELDEIAKAIERVQEETPVERDARYRKDLVMLEVTNAICQQRHEDEEHRVLSEILWDL